MKIDPSKKTLTKSDEVVPPVAHSNPRTHADQGSGDEQADDLPDPAAEASTRFSPRNGEVEMLVAKLGELPETRSERVASIENSIKKGEYRVSAEHIADAIISGMEAQDRQDQEADAVAGTTHDVAEPIGAPVTPVPEPLVLYSRRESRPKKSRRNARTASQSNEFRENSEQSNSGMESDVTESEVTDRDLMEG
jgi:flagellar biosynthesis anti-sigma factor FlgM